MIWQLLHPLHVYLRVVSSKTNYAISSFLSWTEARCSVKVQFWFVAGATFFTFELFFTVIGMIWFDVICISKRSLTSIQHGKYITYLGTLISRFQAQTNMLFFLDERFKILFLTQTFSIFHVCAGQMMQSRKNSLIKITQPNSVRLWLIMFVYNFQSSIIKVRP